MKTIITEKGKVIEKLNIFDKIDNKLEGNKVYDFYYDHIWCPLCRLFYFRPKNFFHNIKLFIQRGKRGYSQEDYWCLNYYLAKYLAGVLDDWVEKSHSYPLELSGKTFTEKEWDLFLKDSSEAFKKYVEFQDTWNFPKQGEYEANMKKIRRFFFILGDNFDSFWD